MLEELRARDLALIEDVALELGPGMTVLTGETGAGKTVLLGALKLLLGDRADAGAVRTGAPEAVVEGRFVAGDRELVVKRRVSADGRSRCSIDGEMATVRMLAERIGPLVDLHGQHEHQALLSPATHVGFLDRWAGEAVGAALAGYRGALREWRAAAARVRDLEARVASAREELERSRHALAEIERVDPRPGEDEELERALPALRHADRLSASVSEALERIRGEGGAIDAVAVAAQVLERAAGIDDRLAELAERVREIAVLLDDVGIGLRDYREGIEHDPEALERTEARLAALNGLMKRFGPTLSDVIALRERAREVVEAAEDGAHAIDRARRDEEAARSALERAAERLATERAAAARSFTDALADRVGRLGMASARFEVATTELPFGSWSDNGSERLEFLYQPAPSSAPRPLSRIASGGEISRVMLAIKTVLGAADTVETLVFDEIDAGIGGRTALAVGELLAELARTHQVIVVTHLAQVAAFADAHFVVRRIETGPEVFTTVVPVEGDKRRAELARMLSGTVSETSLSHAGELLAAARGERSW